MCMKGTFKQLEIMVRRLGKSLLKEYLRPQLMQVITLDRAVWQKHIHIPESFSSFVILSRVTQEK